MILILVPNTRPDSAEYKQLMAHLAKFLGISTRIHTEAGVEQTLTEIYLIGNKQSVFR
jgi:3-deoxy-7-phosphoheptulonate synthase